MYDPAALNMLRYFGCENVPLRLFADGAYAGIAEIMKRYNPKTEILPVSADFHVPENCFAILLAVAG